MMIQAQPAYCGGPMLKNMLAAILLCFILLSSSYIHAQQTSPKPMVQMSTTLGDLTIELYPEQAPETVENFLQYVKDGFYDGTIFHRVIPGFVLQGGGLTEDMQRKPTRDAITNESDNGLRNLEGTLSMARLPDPHSATSQFFINLNDNPHLDHGGDGEWGYAVFGKVIDGMDTVKAIAAVDTTTRGGQSDVPVNPVVIEAVERAE